MNEYYVWYDNFLEELFSMEKKELDVDHPQLKTQLESEKVSFTVVNADDITHAFEVYRDTLPKIEMNDNEEFSVPHDPDSSQSEFLQNTNKKLLH